MIEHYRRPKKSKKLPIFIIFVIIFGVGIWYMLNKQEVKNNQIIIEPQKEEVTVKLPDNADNAENKNQHIPKNNTTKQPKLPGIPLDEVMHLM